MNPLGKMFLIFLIALVLTPFTGSNFLFPHDFADASFTLALAEQKPPLTFSRTQIENLLNENNHSPANWPRELLIRQIYTESGANVHALGGAGEIGLMQIKPNVIDTLRNAKLLEKNLSSEDLWDPGTNLLVGTTYLFWIEKNIPPLGSREKFLRANRDEQIDFVLAAYNQGYGRVERQGITPLAKEYIQRVRTTTKVPQSENLGIEPEPEPIPTDPAPNEPSPVTVSSNHLLASLGLLDQAFAKNWPQ